MILAFTHQQIGGGLILAIIAIAIIYIESYYQPAVRSYFTWYREWNEACREAESKGEKAPNYYIWVDEHYPNVSERDPQFMAWQREIETKGWDGRSFYEWRLAQ